MYTYIQIYIYAIMAIFRGSQVAQSCFSWVAQAQNAHHGPKSGRRGLFLVWFIIVAGKITIFHGKITGKQQENGGLLSGKRLHKPSTFNIAVTLWEDMVNIQICICLMYG